MTWAETHKGDRTFMRPILFELYLDSTHPTVATRWAQWNTPVIAFGETWTPRAITLLSASGNTDDPGVGASFELANADGSGVAAFALAKQGTSVRIWSVDLDPSTGSITSVAESIVCGGLLGAWEANADTNTVTVDPLLPWSGAPIPRRPYTIATFPRLDPKS